jgi:hypothetical protein
MPRIDSANASAPGFSQAIVSHTTAMSTAMIDIPRRSYRAIVNRKLVEQAPRLSATAPTTPMA